MDRVNTFVKNLRKRIATHPRVTLLKCEVIALITDEFQIMLDEEMCALAQAHGIDDSIAEMKEGV